MSRKTPCLERAGHIFIMITWLQYRMVDLIIFKKHPRALKFFIKENRSPTLGRKRKEYWQKTFKQIRMKFVNLFPNLPSNWAPLLEDLNNKRDMIAHGHISLSRNYILYQPALGRRDINTKLKGIRRAIDGKVNKSRVFKLSFDNKNYQTMIAAIREFDEKLFPAIARQMGLDYTKIR